MLLHAGGEVVLGEVGDDQGLLFQAGECILAWKELGLTRTCSCILEVNLFWVGLTRACCSKLEKMLQIIQQFLIFGYYRVIFNDKDKV